jgi:hypothetical protein
LRLHAVSSSGAACRRPRAPTRVGNGGGDDLLRDNAWFLGEQAIRVCLESAGAPASELEQGAVEEAFAVWQRYFTEKRLRDPAFHPERAGAKPIAHGYQWVGCSEAPDLRIVLGTTDDSRLNWERLNEFSGKSAFVVRRRYDSVRGWGRGDLWIASPGRLGARGETQSGRRTWILGHAIHELGHVFGCGHVPDTIMAGEIGKTIEKALTLPESRLATAKDRAGVLWPDQKRELVTCVACPVQVKEGWSHTQWDVFVSLFGVEALHEVSPSYDIDLVKRSKDEPFELEFTSSSAPGFHRKVSFADEKLEPITRGDLPLFKVTFQRSTGAPLETYASYQATLSYSGVLFGTGDDGEKFPIPVRVIRNGGEAALWLGLADRDEFWLKGTRTGPPKDEDTGK